MKLFYLGPIVPPELDRAETDARLRTVIAPIANLVHRYLQLDTCAALVGLRHEHEIGPTPGILTTAIGNWRIRRFDSEEDVLAALLNMGDPFDPTEFYMIRSMISCRAVMYGYDAQAFLCLRTEDEAPISPDPDTIVVEERPDLLLETDYLDGAEAAVDPEWTDDP